LLPDNPAESFQVAVPPKSASLRHSGHRAADRATQKAPERFLGEAVLPRFSARHNRDVRWVRHKRYRLPWAPPASRWWRPIVGADGIPQEKTVVRPVAISPVVPAVSESMIGAEPPVDTSQDAVSPATTVF
jgi:hypothetical protein